MSKTFLSLLLIVIINCTFATANNWCDIDCSYKKGPHILCNYSPDIVSSKCGTIIQSGLTQQDIKKILDAHNSLRQRVASGQENLGNPGPQPPTRNMPNLVWNSQLANIAQAWANQCNDGHRCAHLGNSYSDHVGQNVAISWDDPQASYEQFVHKWYKEVANFNRNHVKNYVPRNSLPMIGHYTQIVWAKTTKVGCGGMKYIENGSETTYLVCNYGPAGNVRDAAVYETI